MFQNSSIGVDNSSSLAYETPLGEGGVLIMPVIYFMVCAIGLVGNTLVIYVVLRYAKMKTVTNIYILNLAVADELFMLGLPFLAMQNALSYWPFGSLMCRLVMTIDAINQFTSIFCLMVMSVDRYLAVVHPMTSTKWRRPVVAKLVNVGVWGFAIVVVLPVIMFSHTKNDMAMCNINWPEPPAVWSAAFILYTAIMGFFAPLVVICLCYLLIVLKVKSSGARVCSTKSRRSERRVTRMVTVVVTVFAICWLPFYLLNIVNIVVPLPREPAIMGLFLFVVVLSYANSCANPLLYAFLSDNFKKSFQKVLRLNRRAGRAEGALRRDTPQAMTPDPRVDQTSTVAKSEEGS